MFKDEFYDLIPKDTVRNLVSSGTTPCYIYFLKIIENRFRALQTCVPPCIKIHYALKANPHQKIIALLAGLGAGADVASLGEIKIALACGIAPENIEFSGPGKTQEELAYAIASHLGSINAESISELDKIISLCGKQQKKAGAGIRINLCTHEVKAGLHMGGETQFGIHEQDILPALELIKKNKRWLHFTGLHVHTGSQILSAEALCENLRLILDRALQIEAAGILPVNKINFGGGWGITYFPHQQKLDLLKAHEGLRNLFSQKAYANLLKDSKLIIEPGRFLVGESGIYATQILYSKKGRSKNYLITDGGMHQNYVLAGGMGQVIRRNFEMDILTNNIYNPSALEKYDIAGCLCTPQDILAVDYKHPGAIAEGDHIVFFNAGAYGYTASPVMFLSHPAPKEIIIP